MGLPHPNHLRKPSGPRERLSEDDYPHFDIRRTPGDLTTRDWIHAPDFKTVEINRPAPRTTVPCIFKWEKPASSCYVSGTFNEWKEKIPLVKSDREFFTIIELPEGTHEYKFLVDGQWKHDPKQPTVSNDLGSQNNVVTVQKSDFEILEALAADSLESGPSSPVTESPPSPKGSYTKIRPSRNRSGSHERVAAPPSLPPHLLQIILNKDIPSSVEPTLLPEPNHVMLNHLYALSIKDGVMVLSTTHRYRKKFVTTVLYKPC